MKRLTTLFISIAVLAFIFFNKDKFSVTDSDIQEKNSTEKSEELKYPNDIEYIKRTFPFYNADPQAHIEALKTGQRMRRENELRSSVSYVPVWEFAGPTNVGGRISDLEYDPR
ncbi:MAG: hypothetical protein R3A12_02095 [Ignavibacteria bacterium]